MEDFSFYIKNGQKYRLLPYSIDYYINEFLFETP